MIATIDMLAPREAVAVNEPVHFVNVVAKDLVNALTAKGYKADFLYAIIIEDDANTNDTALITFYFER